MFILIALGLGIATAVLMWIVHALVGLGAMPSGPNFAGAYLVGIGGALVSACFGSFRGVLRAVIAAAVFYVPVAAMCLHLVRAWTGYPNTGRAQWESIWLWTTIVTFSAAIVAPFVARRLQPDDLENKSANKNELRR
jgi:hypothetical protein